MLDECDVKVRVAEAATELLGLARDPPEWGAADYKAALIEKFQISGSTSHAGASWARR
jgi:hypothetical protein